MIIERLKEDFYAKIKQEVSTFLSITLWKFPVKSLVSINAHHNNTLESLAPRIARSGLAMLCKNITATF